MGMATLPKLLPIRGQEIVLIGLWDMAQGALATAHAVNVTTFIAKAHSPISVTGAVVLQPRLLRHTGNISNQVALCCIIDL